MRFDPSRAMVAAERQGRDFAGGLETLDPAHGAGDADIEAPGGLVARETAENDRVHDAFAKIIGKRHPPPSPSPAGIMNQNIADSGIGLFASSIQSVREPL